MFPFQLILIGSYKVSNVAQFDQVKQKFSLELTLIRLEVLPYIAQFDQTRQKFPLYPSLTGSERCFLNLIKVDKSLQCCSLWPGQTKPITADHFDQVTQIFHYSSFCLGQIKVH